jgi:ABC-type sugar transport system permease subunit
MMTSTTGPRQLMAAGGHPTLPRRNRRSLRDWAATSGFLLPAVALVGIVLLVPFAVTLYRSFFSDTIPNSHFIGFSNYSQLFTDPVLLQSLLNTLMWVIGSLILPVGIGLSIAVMTSAMRGGRFFRLAIILPYALSGTAVAVVGTFMLQTTGAVNQMLKFVGLGSWQQEWLLQWPLNTISAILINSWQSTGVAVVLFMVGLQTIPKETLEAAAIDGADGLGRFTHIVFPLLRPVTAVVIGITLANALRAFDVTWVLTSGGPDRSSETLALSMYRDSFLLNSPGLGSAVAVFLALIVVGTSTIYLGNQLKKL